MDENRGQRATFAYDAAGGLTSVTDVEGQTVTTPYDRWGRRLVPGAPPLPPPPALLPAEPVVSRLMMETLEFRLSGSEEQERWISCASIDCLVPASNNLRVFVTRNGDPAAASSVIGGAEVRTELRPRGVVCIARRSDFNPRDLVVVQQERGCGHYHLA